MDTIADADGLTTVLTAVAVVQCGQTYHIRLAIADGTDGALSSFVWLEAGSFFSPALTVTDDLGVKKDVSSFVVPVGATINMDGTAIMQGLATMFIASTVGIDLTLIQYGQIVVLAIVTSIGTAAVPSAGTVTLALILGSLGLPLDAIGLILAVDRILDMIRTAVNVCGDAAVSCIVAKSEN